MKAYIDIVQNVLDNGQYKKPVRVDDFGNVDVLDNDTLGLPNIIFSHDMQEGFPLLTTKKMPMKTVAVELEGFIKGITDKRWYEARKCNIWSQWSNPIGCPNWLSKEERKQHQLLDSDLGPIYGANWRHFNKHHVPVSRPLNNDKITVCGVANRGTPDKRFADKLKGTWYGMIRRCYIKEDKDYNRYGARGVYVVNRWLTFENFINDVQKIPNWNDKLQNWNEYSLDKDYYQTKCYGPNTALWLHSDQQHFYKSTVKPIYALSPNNDIFYYRNIKECAENHNLDSTSIARCISGKYNHHKGWQFWRNVTDDSDEQCVDQLQSIADKLRNNPTDRRMVCSAWNPNQIKQMALPPCHFAWNLVVYGDTLNLIWHQRSCDLMLGVPFNIASYALLLSLLANHAGLKPGNLTGTLNDCHIYLNQVDAAREQVGRVPLELPTLTLEGGQSIFDWSYKDIDITGYKSFNKLDFGQVTI